MSEVIQKFDPCAWLQVYSCMLSIIIMLHVEAMKHLFFFYISDASENRIFL